MEPLHSYNGEDFEEEHTKPHIVYRKNALKKTVEESTACETSGEHADAPKHGDILTFLERFYRKYH